MVFSSAEFIWFFLPIVLVIYFGVGVFERNGNVVKNIVLLIASLIFYAWGEPYYILLLLFSIIMNYIFGLLVEKKKNRCILAFAVCANLGILGIFKYFNFIFDNINAIFATNFFAGLEIILPIGISFFTFQALSYVIDVYRGDNKAQNNPLDLALYISFFPQLIAGPIVKYKDIERQLKKRKTSIEKMTFGIRRFIFGLGKKCVLSNACAEVADVVFDSDINFLSTPIAWIGIMCYTFQIYYDFSGYSDMAIGLGKIFGFEFLENFNFPYISTSIQEFWRRWHISLSSWFKEYLYIPLGENRKGKVRTYLNLLIVFFCTGFWHGASWNFIVWGMFHGFFQLLERGKWGEYIKNKRILGHFYTMLIVMVGWVFFRAESLPKALQYLHKMFVYDSYSIYTIGRYMNCYIIVIIFLSILLCGLLQNKSHFLWGKSINNPLQISFMDCSICLLIMAITGVLIVCNTYNPFIYFQF